jgi:UDP-N-acetylmuramoyl-tripeptide--D-alanyl-D-alanine ligase
MYLNEHFLSEALPEVTLISKSFPEDARFSVDSRSLQPGDIFVAVPGQCVDGHNFIHDALKAGAAGLVIENSRRDILRQIDARLLEKILVVSVPDTLDALYRLAAARREKFTRPVIAVTGSVGKTSTKEMLAHIIKCGGRTCLASYANQNTKLGVALNLLRLKDSDSCAVLEVGINARGEMADIAGLLRPNFAIITGIAHCHLAGLGSMADVAAEKRALFKYLTGDNIGIINGDQPLLAGVGYHHPVIRFGFKTTNQVQARRVSFLDDRVRFVLKIYREKFMVDIPYMHSGLLNSVLAASSAAYLLGIPTRNVIEAISNPPVVPGRFERRALKNYKGILIHDAYNANPESMKAALSTFSKLHTSARKIVVLGDMLELGANSPFWHRQLGRVLRKMSATHRIILVGSEIQWTKKALPVGACVDAVDTWQDALPVLEKHLDHEAVVLVKGSHGTGLYQLAEQLSEPLK